MNDGSTDRKAIVGEWNYSPNQKISIMRLNEKSKSSIVSGVRRNEEQEAGLINAIEEEKRWRKQPLNSL